MFSVSLSTGGGGGMNHEPRCSPGSEQEVNPGSEPEASREAGRVWFASCGHAGGLSCSY